MGKIKIIFFDIDGTLLRLRAKELSEKTVEALNRLKANGIRLCIATGRTPVSLPHCLLYTSPSPSRGLGDVYKRQL